MITYTETAFSQTFCNCRTHTAGFPVAARRYTLINQYLEPVDGAAVDEGGELAQSVAEGVTDGAEGDHDVQVGTATADEESKQLQRRQLLVLVTSLCERSH